MTLRIHDDAWAEISAAARRLEIPYAEFLRGAISFYMGYQAGAAVSGELEAHVNVLDTRVRAIVAHLQTPRRGDAG
jgi:hypothetical protein